MTTTRLSERGEEKRRPWVNLLAGAFFSLLLLFFGFFVLRATELALRLALAPFILGPLVWPLAFWLSADLRSRTRRALFISVMAAHYIGLASALWLEEGYEWCFYRGVFTYAFPQVLIYMWGQFILWRRFGRDTLHAVRHGGKP